MLNLGLDPDERLLIGEDRALIDHLLAHRGVRDSRAAHGARARRSPLAACHVIDSQYLARHLLMKVVAAGGTVPSGPRESHRF